MAESKSLKMWAPPDQKAQACRLTSTTALIRIEQLAKRRGRQCSLTLPINVVSDSVRMGERALQPPSPQTRNSRLERYRQSLTTLLASLLLFLPVLNCKAVTHETWTPDEIWDAITIFEGAPSTVTGDFDCQGMSIGSAQWNIGKSFGRVREIIQSNPDSTLNRLMPKYGSSFVKALEEGKQETLKYVRSLQTRQSDSCDSNMRKSRWTAEGRIFEREIKSALSTPESISTQRNLRKDLFNQGLNNSESWAVAMRGDGASPTKVEVAYFVDMTIFNGGGLSKFGLKYNKIDQPELDKCLAETVKYLREQNAAFLLHRRAAHKNAEMLNTHTLNESERNLFCLAYRVAQQINKPYAKQFRLTTINRRAAILFGSAFYADGDTDPVQINLH